MSRIEYLSNINVLIYRVYMNNVNFIEMDVCNGHVVVWGCRELFEDWNTPPRMNKSRYICSCYILNGFMPFYNLRRFGIEVNRKKIIPVSWEFERIDANSDVCDRVSLHIPGFSFPPTIGEVCKGE